MRRNARIFHPPTIASVGRARMRGRHSKQRRQLQHPLSNPYLQMFREHNLFLKGKARTTISNVKPQVSDT